MRGDDMKTTIRRVEEVARIVVGVGVVEVRWTTSGIGETLPGGGGETGVWTVVGRVTTDVAVECSEWMEIT